VGGKADLTASWPIKRLRFSDKLLVAFGGDNIIDNKIMFIFPNRPFYYTTEMLLPFDATTSAIPFNVHRTSTGQVKEHEPVLFGSFEFPEFLHAVSQYVPTVEEFNLSSIKGSAEAIVLDDFLPRLFTRELDITSLPANSLSYTTANQLNETKFSIAIVNQGQSHSLVLNQMGHTYVVTLPQFDQIEGVLEKSISYSFEPAAKQRLRSDFSQLEE
jgi:hypothetical protein